ncbi:MAG: hypothetical protein IJU98_12165 [Synergistaceae bacterium]|nr:hypothetical protein [Synergistaceae bacterium]
MKPMRQNTAYRVNSAGRLVRVEEYDPSRMVIRTLTPGMKLTQTQKVMLEDAARQPIVYESDCPELTPEMAEAFRRAATVRDAGKPGRRAAITQTERR